MRKKELVHLHALLSEVGTKFNAELSEYKQQATRSTSIHHSKIDHKEAVQSLCTDLVKKIDTDSPQNAQIQSAD